MTADVWNAPPPPMPPVPGDERAMAPGDRVNDAPGHPAVRAALTRAVAEGGGRITFAAYMAICLYHPAGGYYLQPERRPGRAGDFLTAPETHPFFGRALAAFVAEGRDRLGRPAPFTVREYGAGTGALAWDILGGLAETDPAALTGLRYELVEANPFRRAEALAALAEAGYREVVAAPDPADPLAPIDGVVLANEVADAFPVHRLVWRDGALRERWVVSAADGSKFAEQDGPLSPPMAAFDPAAYLARHGVVPREDDRFDLSPAAAGWFAGAVRAIRRGYALVIDYGYEAPTLFSGHRLGGTVRVYRGHAVGDDPFIAPGDADLTAHVDFSLLREAAAAEGMVVAGFATQGELLAGLGLGDLLVRLGQDPTTTAADYYAAQAAVLRLVDPGGMGRFRALAVARAAPVAPPLRAFSVRV
jgi:SAM-dependent MidA family methyltransferase